MAHLQRKSTVSTLLKLGFSKTLTQRDYGDTAADFDIDFQSEKVYQSNLESGKDQKWLNDIKKQLEIWSRRNVARVGNANW